MNSVGNLKWNSEKALQMTLQWYKGYKIDPQAITESQIAEYLE